MTIERSGGELIVDTLKVHGVETVFGVLSVHNIPVYDAIDRQGGPRPVAARTEQGAVSMADGYARASGRLGVAITSTGVGAANAAGPLLEAFVAGIPVLHVTGQVDAAYLDQDRGVLHAGKDQLNMLRGVCKAALRVERTEQIPEVMAEAIRIALSGRCGPVSVEVPIDQQYRRIPAAALPAEPLSPLAPDPQVVEQAAALVRAARRPMLWVGGGAVSADASLEVRQLAERLGAGVLTTAAGRTTLPEDHPLCIGNFGLDPSVGTLLDEADVLVAIGTRFRTNETRGWHLSLPKPLVQIDVDPEQLGRNYPVDVGIVGDARLSVAALLDAVGTGAPAAAGWQDRVSVARAESRARLRATLGPYERVMDDLRATLPRNAILVRDVTVPATSWGSRLLEVYEPRTQLHSATLSIGLGLATAIGAAIARPDRKVLLLAGDGGFAMNMGEMGTAIQEGLENLSIIVFNDAGYGILRNLQDAHFNSRRFAVDLTAPDFAGVARSFGAWAGQISSAAELKPLLREALNQDRPSLIEVDMQSVGPVAVPFTGAARLIPEAATVGSPR